MGRLIRDRPHPGLRQMWLCAALQVYPCYSHSRGSRFSPCPKAGRGSAPTGDHTASRPPARVSGRVHIPPLPNRDLPSLTECRQPCSTRAIMEVDISRAPATHEAGASSCTRNDITHRHLGPPRGSPVPPLVLRLRVGRSRLQRRFRYLSRSFCHRAERSSEIIIDLN